MARGEVAQERAVSAFEGSCGNVRKRSRALKRLFPDFATHPCLAGLQWFRNYSMMYLPPIDLEWSMGRIETGKPYSCSGLQFKAILDLPVTEQWEIEVARRLTQVITPLDAKLFPVTFGINPGSRREATILFSRRLSNEDARRALEILCTRLVDDSYLISMPELPDPLWSQW